MDPAAREGRRPWHDLLPLGLALAAFGSSLGADFVLDDREAILGHPAVTAEAPVAEILTRTFWGRPLGEPPPSWRPLATATFALDFRVFGASPTAFHATSLAVYLALVWATGRVAGVWLGPAAACLGACLFAVHPLHAEVAASLVGRADALALLLTLLALLALEPALRGRPVARGRVGAAAGSFAAALLSKESALALPLVLAALLLAAPPVGPATAPPWRRLGRATAPAIALGLVALAYAGLRAALLPGSFSSAFVPDDVLRGASPGQRVLFALHVLAESAGLVARPLDLCTGRKYAELALPPGFDARAGLGLLVAAAAVAHAFWARRASRPPLALAAILAWLPFSHLVASAPEALADRFLLAPTFFLAVLVAGAAARWLRLPGSRPMRLARRALVALFVAALAVSAAVEALPWRSELALLAHGVRACPSSVHNHARLAEALERRGRGAEAAWHFAVAAEGRRHFPHPWRHPAAAAETAVSPEERLRRAPELLGVPLPAAAWRERLAATLDGIGYSNAARAARASR